MKYYIVKRNNKVIAERVELANSFKSKLMGLMFSKDLGNRDGLLFHLSNSIHTCFMNYPIDVIFMDKEDKVVRVIRNMKPWRMTRMYFTATKVLELMGGTLKEDLPLGEKLEIECIN